MEETKVKEGQVRVQSPPHLLYNNSNSNSVTTTPFSTGGGTNFMQQIQPQHFNQGQGHGHGHGHNFGPLHPPSPYNLPNKGPPPPPPQTNMNSGPWPPPPPSPSRSPSMNYAPPTPSPSPSMNYGTSSTPTPSPLPNYGHGPLTPNQNQNPPVNMNYGPQTPNQNQNPAMTMNYAPSTPSPNYGHGPLTPNQNQNPPVSSNYAPSPSIPSPNYGHGPLTPNQNQNPPVSTNYGPSPSTPSPNYGHGPLTPNQNQNPPVSNYGPSPSTPSPNYGHGPLTPNQNPPVSTNYGHGPLTPNQNPPVSSNYGPLQSTPSPNYGHGPLTPNQNQNPPVSTNYGPLQSTPSPNYGHGPLTPNQNQNPPSVMSNYPRSTPSPSYGPGPLQNPPVSTIGTNYVHGPPTQNQNQNPPGVVVNSSGGPPPPPPTTSSSNSGELQNELLKQLLQNTGCASMSQVLSEASGFSLLNTCLTTKSPTSTTVTVPLRTSHLSEAATRIPQPTPRPFENLQQQQQQQQHQQQQHEAPSQMQQQQPPPSPSPAPMPVQSYRHPPQVYDWNSNANVRPQPSPSPLTSPRLSSDGSPLIGPPPPPPPDRDVALTPKSDQSEFLTTNARTATENTNSNNSGVTPGVGAVDGIDHKPMLDMTMFSSLPPSTTGPKKMDDEAKKAKRRQYQAKRRQTQIKEQQLQQQLLQQQQQQQQTPPLTPTTPTPTPSTPKKRARKASKIEENYDGFIENLMTQLRRLPPVGVVEPEIERNYSICECSGQSDLSNLKFKTNSTGTSNKAPQMYIGVGDLEGELGCSTLTHRLDYYNSQQSPGEDHPVRLPQQQIQRGFYYQEFACPRILLPGDKAAVTAANRTPTPIRDTDTPDTIVSCSSPECGLDTKKSLKNRYMGLKVIDPDDLDTEESASAANPGKDDRESPDITIVSPIPVRPNMLTNHVDKENQNREIVPRPQNRLGFGTGLRNNGNVSVTLTLSSSASDDIGVVLRDLANILALTSPAAAAAAALQQKTNDLYVYKSKDGKEFDDIQSILNGATKFCRHCDVIILSNMIKKTAADFPGIVIPTQPDSLDSPNEFYFCTSTCLLQFSIAQGLSTGAELEDKPGTIVSHPSETKHQQQQRKRTISVTSGSGTGMELVPYDPADPEGPPKKKWKGIRYKQWTANIKPEQKYKKASEKEMTEMLFRLGITVLPKHLQDDTRKCLFCQKTGDGISNGPARLLNVDVDKYVHLNCALWSKEVYETENGGLVNLEGALKSSLVLTCVLCKQKGGTVKCFKNRCSSVYHLGCAVKEGCLFSKNKTMFCPAHVSKEEKGNELTTLKVNRRVYIQRDENRQVGAVLHHAHADSSQNYLLRVGSLILLNIGQLLPHQLAAFHSRNYIYPIGFKIVRFYWSMKRLNKRCQYICSIHEVDGKPEFRISPQEEAGVVVGTSKESQCLKSDTARGAWLQVVEPVAKLRAASNGIKVFPKYITGEDLFGLTEPAIVKVLESLPGVETLTDYHFKYGRNPLLELPLAINPTGCARSEPKLRTHFKRPHGTQRTAGLFASAASASTSSSSSSYLSEFGLSCPYSKQFVHSKSSQYKKMKQEWRNNIYLARSKIQGLGLYAARDIEKHTMVIEYIGEIIRKKLADRRENRYEAQNRGIYMFRIDDDRVIDATLCGGLARYINHSCNPNCITETVEVDRDLKIIIFANRRISRGEELSYDYKFEFEDAQHKIPCLCGASSCRQWMN